MESMETSTPSGIGDVPSQLTAAHWRRPSTLVSPPIGNEATFTAGFFWAGCGDSGPVGSGGGLEGVTSTLLLGSPDSWEPLSRHPATTARTTTMMSAEQPRIILTSAICRHPQIDP
jgi:hypothetical protein